MKVSKITLGMVVVVAIGIFALPTTLSVGTGQHHFRQINASDPGAFCARCHGLQGDPVQAELNASDTSLYYSAEGGVYGQATIHNDQTCGTCHQLTNGYGMKNVAAAGLGNSTNTEHAAIIPSCLDCHSVGPGADTVDVTAELDNASEAHKPLWDNSSSQGGNVPKDLACLGCHTDVAKSGTPAYNYSLTNGSTVEGINIGW